MACVSALCLAALVLSSGMAESHRSRCGNPALVAFLGAWLISGAGLGLLFKSGFGAFFGFAFAVALLFVLGFFVSP